MTRIPDRQATCGIQFNSGSMSDSSSEDEDEARRRKELASCVVTAEQVSTQGESERKRRRPAPPPADAEAGDGAAGKSSSTADDPQDRGGTSYYLASTLSASLGRTLEFTLGVWDEWASKVSRTEACSQLRLFNGSSTTVAHTPVDGVASSGSRRGMVAPVSALAKIDGQTGGEEDVVQKETKKDKKDKKGKKDKKDEKEKKDKDEKKDKKKDKKEKDAKKDKKEKRDARKAKRQRIETELT